MDSRISMKKQLLNIPLYDINKPQLNNELKAYSLMINELNDEISRMLCECFISTAQSYGLEKRELLIGNARDDLSVQQRRKMLLLREEIDSNSFTVEKIKKACESFTLTSCNITEYPSVFIVSVDIFGNYSLSQKSWIKEQIRKIIPAHLKISISFNGYTWAYSDMKNNNFSYIDSLDYTWEEIDNMI